MKEHIIKRIIPDSIAEELGIQEGDELISINNQEIKDIFDFQYLTSDEVLEVHIRHQDGQEVIYDIEKDYDQELGIDFMEGLMDDYQSCNNRCIFCFIHQMPRGMRKSLYFQDDDSRLSFLQGNYITLTNLTNEDVERLIEYRLEPINISIHTMNPELREKMLLNQFAGESLKYLDRFKEAGIRMNGQIVLCKGVNDGIHLEESLEKLLEYMPEMESISVVPAGLTKFRKHLYPLTPFNEEESKQVIEQVDFFQKKAFKRFGHLFVRCSDEWYLKAGLELPPSEFYEGFGQIENGVGMIRLLEEEYMKALSEVDIDVQPRHLSIATGVLATPLLEKIAKATMEKYPQLQINVYCIYNHFFGEEITVAGLITGKDLQNQLENQLLGTHLLITENMLKFETDIFLDDMSIKDIEDKLKVKIRVVKSEGMDLLNQILR